MKDGISAKIVDDVVVGGETMAEAANNYIRVLEKLHAANLKVTSEKNVIFPREQNFLDGSGKREVTCQPILTELLH